MSRLSRDGSQAAGSLAPLNGPASNGSTSLDKNGLHQSGAVPPTGASRTRRTRPSRFIFLPVIVAAVCGTGAFVASSFYMTRWYSTAETIWFPPTGNQGTSGILNSLIGGGAADASGSVPILGGIYNSPQFGTGPNTAITALDSGRAKARVMDQLHLAQRWHLPPDEAGLRFSKNVTYGVDKDGLLAIQVTDTDPRLAYQMVNTYVKAMQDVSTELSTSFAHKNLVAVRQRYAVAHDALLRQERALVALQTQTAQTMPLGGAATGAYVDLMNQRTAMQTELNATDAAIKAQIETARKTYGGSLDLPTSVPFANSTIDAVRKAEAEFARISAIYGPDYPGYREAQDRVVQARSQANAELKRQLSATTKFISPVMSDLYIKQRTQQSQLASLTAAANARQEDMLSLPAAQMRQDDLKRQISLSNALDSTLAQAVTQAELAEKRDVPTFTVIDEAGIPNKPVLPRVGYTTALAAVVGFLMTLAWLAGRTLLGQPMSQEQMRRWTETYGLTEREDLPEALDGERPAPLVEQTAPQLSHAEATAAAAPAADAVRAELPKPEKRTEYH